MWIKSTTKSHQRPRRKHSPIKRSQLERRRMMKRMRVNLSSLTQLQNKKLNSPRPRPRKSRMPKTRWSPWMVNLSQCKTSHSTLARILLSSRHLRLVELHFCHNWGINLFKNRTSPKFSKLSRLKNFKKKVNKRQISRFFLMTRKVTKATVQKKKSKSLKNRLRKTWVKPKQKKRFRMGKMLRKTVYK